MTAIAPGALIGVVGGGQLGRMFAMAAKAMGYRVAVFTDAPASPGAQLADAVVVGDYGDAAAIAEFAAGVEALTVEFENISSAAVAAAQHYTIVRPGPGALHSTQHRGREKAMLTRSGLPTVPYRLVAAGDESGFRAALLELGCPCVVKTAGFGYDGKGQAVVASADTGLSDLPELANTELVVEKRIALACEISVVAARSASGAVACYAPIINTHVNGVLDLSLQPRTSDYSSELQLIGSLAPGSYSSAAPDVLTPELLRAARECATELLVALEYVGVACVEFFVDDAGTLSVNEVAPRPHNSGHLTIEGCYTSQFEQQVRALCGLPLGSPEPLAAAAMVNLLGDEWHTGQPDWAAALAVPGVSLHLYGKAEGRPGRKMGHMTAVASDVAEALLRVELARSGISRA